MVRTKGPGPNQSDLAAALGLSVSTISRALADSPSISETVKERVARAAIEIGYRTRPSGTQTTLKSIFVLVGIHDVNNNVSGVYQEMLKGLKARAQQMALPLVTRMIVGSPDLSPSIDDNVDPTTGLVFLGLVPNPETIAQLKERNIVSVIVNGVDPTLQVDSVSPSNYFGGRLVAEHLANLGHKRVVFVGGPNRWTLTRRFHGFRDRLEEIFGDQNCIVDSLHLTGGTSESNLERLKQWLPERLKIASAVFCFNDGIALSAIEAINSMGLSVPQDISVVGFDDLPMATFSTPTLTTFRIDWLGVGAEALQYLSYRRLHPVGPGREMQFGGALIARESTGQINANFA